MTTWTKTWHTVFSLTERPGGYNYLSKIIFLEKSQHQSLQVVFSWLYSLHMSSFWAKFKKNEEKIKLHRAFNLKMSSITWEYSWGRFYWKGGSIRENMVILDRWGRGHFCDV